MCQGTSMTLMFEPLESSNDMMWVTQRFELVKDYTKTKTSISGGLETQSAILGNYGGFYAFGFTGGVYQYLRPWVFAHMGGSIASGGGAGAPDGDGLMYRGYAGMSVKSKYGFVDAAYNHINFPSGAITSNHISIGYTYVLPYRIEYSDHNSYYPTYFELVTGLWFLGPEDASRNSEPVQSAYAGVRVGQYLNTNHTVGAELQLGAGALGSIDGYMNYSMGLRFNTPSQRLFFRTHLGSGGGGGVYTGGGLSTMVSAGAQIGGHQFSVGQWTALSDEASIPFVSYSRHIDFKSSLGFHRKGVDYTYNDSREVALKVLAGAGQQRSPGLDRNGNPYNPMSGIAMGLGIEAWSNENFSLDAYGHAFWAASGGYGAYAEGLFSAAFMKNGETFRYGVDLTSGIAGGGGIEVGSGLMIAPGVQVECKIGPLSNLKMNLRQKYFPGGTYSPVYFGVELIQSLPVSLW
ncbi:hypothetical protein OAI64_00890 [Schleiferiaceae bacterium]|nr:hypothetical protein [Schleiferiaceae bacterium]MDC0082751.1 hypothetical protein [Schleiferiaceae bacterium]